jgi:hypothetical protein
MTYTLGQGNHRWMTDMLNRYNNTGTVKMLPHYSGGAMAHITEGPSNGNAGYTTSGGSVQVNPYHLAQGVQNFDNWIMLHELGHAAGMPHTNGGLMTPAGGWGGGNVESLGGVIGQLRSAYGSSGRPRAPVMKRGGVFKGGGMPKGMGRGARAVVIHAGERVLPRNVVRSFDGLANAITAWMRKGGKDGIGGGGTGTGTGTGTDPTVPTDPGTGGGGTTPEEDTHTPGPGGGRDVRMRRAWRTRAIKPRKAIIGGDVQMPADTLGPTGGGITLNQNITVQGNIGTDLEELRRMAQEGFEDGMVRVARKTRHSVRQMVTTVSSGGTSG